LLKLTGNFVEVEIPEHLNQGLLVVVGDYPIRQIVLKERTALNTSVRKVMARLVDVSVPSSEYGAKLESPQGL
jgi:hypothetical protein